MTSEVVPVDVADGASDVDVTDGPHDVVGFSLRNTGGSTTTVYLRDGAGGRKVAVVVLDAGKAETRPVGGPDGVRCSTKVVLDRDGSVNVEGSVWVR